MWRFRPAPDATRSPGSGLRRRMLVAGAATATVAAMAPLAIGGTAAQAALAPGTPLKTLAQANGGRYFGSDMTGNLLSQSTVTQLQAQQFNMTGAYSASVLLASIAIATVVVLRLVNRRGVP